MIDEAFKTKIEALIPRGLDDIIRKNREHCQIRHATEDDLKPLLGEVAAAYPKLVITNWHLVTQADTVERMLKAMRGCKVQIFAIRNDHGLLDVRAVAEPESELKVCRAILVFQQWASISCDNCGARGRKMIIGGRVRVLCADCMNKFKED